MSSKRRKPESKPFRGSTRARPGIPPGTLTAPPGAVPPTLHVIDYVGDQLVERELQDLSELRDLVESDSVSWVDVVGLGDADLIGELGGMFGIHRLVLEDVLNVGQRPKLEASDAYVFFVSRLAVAGEALESEQLSLIFGANFVLTFQERPGDCFDPVRERIRAGRKRIRSLGCDYLSYALIDTLVDSYFPVIDSYRDRLEEIEDEIVEGASRDVIQRIHRIKRDLRYLRRTVGPTEGAVYRLMDPETELVSNETRVFIADCHDHAMRLQDLVDASRELGSDLVDLQLSQVGQRMNEIMKVLTIFAAIFIPLTFIAGLYGMNFDPSVSRWNMPELGWAYGYPAALGAMLVVGVLLFLYFVRKGWVGRD